MLFFPMQQVRKLHLTIQIQSMSKVFVILEHVSMKKNARRPRWQVSFWWQKACFFHSTQLLWVSGHGYYNNWFYTVIPQVTTCMRLRCSPEITVVYWKSLEKSSLCFLDLLFCDEGHNYKIGISVTLFWKSSTRSGFLFYRK